MGGNMCRQACLPTGNAEEELQAVLGDELIGEESALYPMQLKSGIITFDMQLKGDGNGQVHQQSVLPSRHDTAQAIDANALLFPASAHEGVWANLTRMDAAGAAVAAKAVVQAAVAAAESAQLAKLQQQQPAANAGNEDEMDGDVTVCSTEANEESLRLKFHVETGMQERSVASRSAAVGVTQRRPNLDLTVPQEGVAAQQVSQSVTQDSVKQVQVVVGGRRERGQERGAQREGDSDLIIEDRGQQIARLEDKAQILRGQLAETHRQIRAARQDPKTPIWLELAPDRSDLTSDDEPDEDFRI